MDQCWNQDPESEPESERETIGNKKQEKADLHDPENRGRKEVTNCDSIVAKDLKRGSTKVLFNISPQPNLKPKRIQGKERY